MNVLVFLESVRAGLLALDVPALARRLRAASSDAAAQALMDREIEVILANAFTRACTAVSGCGDGVVPDVAGRALGFAGRLH